MSIVITFLWLLGFTFFAILWMGVAASVFRMAREMTSFDTWRRGLVAGAIGCAAVVVLYAGLNALANRNLLLAPALLGEALLGRPIGGAIEAAPVFIYTGLHLVVFLILGLFAAWLLLESEPHPKIWYPAFVLLLVVFLNAIGFVLWLAAPAGPALPAWSVVIGSAAAGILMATYLLAARRHALVPLGGPGLEA
jgi:hypothetical protein